MRIVIGEGSCGIAAGARPVLNAFVEGVSEAGISDKVTVTQTGCIGMCQYEPIVEVLEPGKEKVTYVKVKPEQVARIVNVSQVQVSRIEKKAIGMLRDMME